MSLRVNIRKCSSIDVGHRDVLLGRSRRSYSHSGNVLFRELVCKHVDKYQKKAARATKAALLTKLICRVHATGGRFLRFEGGGWVEVPDKTAKEKVSHALRDARLALLRENSSDGLPSTSFLSSSLKGTTSSTNVGTARGDQVAVFKKIVPSPPIRRLPPLTAPSPAVSDPQLMVSNQEITRHLLRVNLDAGTAAVPCSPRIVMNAPTTEEQALDFQIQNLIRLRNSIHEIQLLNEALQQNNAGFTFPQLFNSTHPPPQSPPPRPSQDIFPFEQRPVPSTRIAPQEEHHRSSVEPSTTPPPHCANRHRQATIEQVWFGLPEISDDEIFHEKEEAFFDGENTHDVKSTIKALERALDICGDDFDNHVNDEFLIDNKASRCSFQSS